MTNTLPWLLSERPEVEGNDQDHTGTLTHTHM